LRATLGETLLNGKLQWHYGEKMNRIAIYDMDKTLTRKATFGPFILFVMKKYRRSRIWALPVMAIVTFGYGLKLISRERLKETNLRLLLGSRIDADELAHIARDFAHASPDTVLLDQAADQISADRAAGYRIVIASASYRFYVEQIAQGWAVNDIIATDCKIGGPGIVLPEIDGENCYGEGKLRMVRAWLSDQGIDRETAHIRFYSDHVSDAPCLEWADEAFAVNAHKPLATLASERGWEQRDWLSES
jgi:HAD superfamily hydrolase (TIGR01490 family)